MTQLEFQRRRIAKASDLLNMIEPAEQKVAYARAWLKHQPDLPHGVLDEFNHALVAIHRAQALIQRRQRRAQRKAERLEAPHAPANTL